MTSESKMRQVCLEMIEQRNYSLIDNEENYISAVKPDGELFYILFLGITQFNISNLYQCTSLMNEYDTKHALITYKEKVTSQALKAVEKMDKGLSIDSEGQFPSMKIELFAEEDLQYNITKHRLQPRFQLVEKEEAEEFKKKWSKFGIMKLNDPVARFLNYEKGDVIRIIRIDGIISYRIVR